MSDMSYDESKAFLLAFSRIYTNSEKEVADGIEANERRSAAIAKKGMRMAIDDTIAMMSRVPHTVVIELDRQLKSLGAPTLAEIRASNSGYVKKLLRKRSISSEDEYHVLRSLLDGGQIDSEELKSKIQERVDRYEGI